MKLWILRPTPVLKINIIQLLSRRHYAARRKNSNWQSLSHAYHTVALYVKFRNDRPFCSRHRNSHFQSSIPQNHVIIEITSRTQHILKGIWRFKICLVVFWGAIFVSVATTGRGICNTDAPSSFCLCICCIALFVNVNCTVIEFKNCPLFPKPHDCMRVKMTQCLI